MATQPNNFLGLEPRWSSYDRARFAVLPVPYDSAATFHTGARFGPAAVITASQHVELFDEELEVECHRAGIATLDPIEPNLAGPHAMHEDLHKAARRIVRAGKFLFALGGDHSISSALVRAVMAKHKKLSVLQIDAHDDLRDTFYGSPHAHACVMRRIDDLGASIIPVGLRSVSREGLRFMRQARITPVTSRRCRADDKWIEGVIDRLGDQVYVTIDIDAFDPAFAPGTGAPEPGGLDWYHVTKLLRRVAVEKTVVAADVVEVMPIAGQVVTESLAARLAYKLMCYVQTGR